jgi:hypothetical protein
MTEILIDENVEIRVEFTKPVQPAAGTVGQVMRGSSGTVEAVVDRSQEALNKAMGAIKQMAKRVLAVKDSLAVSERPTTIEVEFALKLDSEAGVYIAKAGAEASFNVKLVWERKDDDA